MKIVTPLNTEKLYVSTSPINKKNPYQIRKITNLRFFAGFVVMGQDNIHPVFRIDSGISIVGRKVLKDLGLAEICEYNPPN